MQTFKIIFSEVSKMKDKDNNNKMNRGVINLFLGFSQLRCLYYFKQRVIPFQRNFNFFKHELGFRVNKDTTWNGAKEREAKIRNKISRLEV